MLIKLTQRVDVSGGSFPAGKVLQVHPHLGQILIRDGKAERAQSPGHEAPERVKGPTPGKAKAKPKGKPKAKAKRTKKSDKAAPQAEDKEG